MKILVAQDDPVLADAILCSLRASGAVVDHVATGPKADTALIAHSEFDLLILDLDLPTLHGLEILERLRARGSHLPVLVLTGADSVEERVKSLDKGADDCMAKPFSLEELKARVRALSRRPSRGRPLQHVWSQLEHELLVEVNTPTHDCGGPQLRASTGFPQQSTSTETCLGAGRARSAMPAASSWLHRKRAQRAPPRVTVDLGEHVRLVRRSTSITPKVPTCPSASHATSSWQFRRVAAARLARRLSAEAGALPFAAEIRDWIVKEMRANVEAVELWRPSEQQSTRAWANCGKTPAS